jgi:hypothetical protein
VINQGHASVEDLARRPQEPETLFEAQHAPSTQPEDEPPRLEELIRHLGMTGRRRWPDGWVASADFNDCVLAVARPEDRPALRQYRKMRMAHPAFNRREFDPEKPTAHRKVIAAWRMWLAAQPRAESASAKPGRGESLSWCTCDGCPVRPRPWAGEARERLPGRPQGEGRAPKLVPELRAPEALSALRAAQDSHRLLPGEGSRRAQRLPQALHARVRSRPTTRRTRKSGAPTSGRTTRRTVLSAAPGSAATRERTRRPENANAAGVSATTTTTAPSSPECNLILDR